MRSRVVAPLLASLAIATLLGACQQTDTPGSEAPPPVAATAPAASTPSTAPEPQDNAGPVTPEVPALRVTTLDGQPYDLAAHRGKWVVVNFWATWCGPCLKEMPELSALDAMHEHVEVLGLAYEDIEPAAMREFLLKHPVVYPIAIVDIYDPPADFETPRGLPMTYLIAPDGTVAKQVVGPVTARAIEDAIAAAGGPQADAGAAGGDAIGKATADPG